jgi:hypothetical protein
VSDLQRSWFDQWMAGYVLGSFQPDGCHIVTFIGGSIHAD